MLRAKTPVTLPHSGVIVEPPASFVINVEEEGGWNAVNIVYNVPAQEDKDKADQQNVLEKLEGMRKLYQELMEKFQKLESQHLQTVADLRMERHAAEQSLETNHQLKEQLFEATATIDHLKMQSELSEGQKKEIATQYNAAKESIKAQELHTEELQRHIKGINGSCDNLVKNNKELLQQNEVLQSLIEDLRKQIAFLSAEKEQDKIDSLKQRRELEQSIQKLEDELEKKRKEDILKLKKEMPHPPAAKKSFRSIFAYIPKNSSNSQSKDITLYPTTNPSRA